MCGMREKSLFYLLWAAKYMCTFNYDHFMDYLHNIEVDWIEYFIPYGLVFEAHCGRESILVPSNPLMED